ncbi:MAG: universal stress protein, partial [Gluconacetobacter diazotrophicus]|nr:universal stress protein [Gluconacetobacter diazotrophicus]
AGAERVVVLQVDGRDPSPLPGEVFHDLAVERRAVPARNGDTGAQLLDMAAEVDADLLVMGGYDRGELRERLFDGVTEQVLREARLPVLLQPRRA